MSRNGDRCGASHSQTGARWLTGFTLIELVITVAIVAILALIALPSYQRYVDRTHRSVATSTLLELSNLQAQQRLLRREDADDFETLVGIDAEPLFVGRDRQLQAAATADSLYQISLDSDDPSGWRLIATAVGRQLRDLPCREISLDRVAQQRAQSAEGDDRGDECWR
ncbi:type IV pilin protein [Polycyclovorans algicola]|uniref:type IV pilin protein n=1 Tax=Polycyclovorans algicola TaxID=616992 RepID=UPI00069366C5|nr:type IV pilin protein [Polycyclovorans algicola]